MSVSKQAMVAAFLVAGSMGAMQARANLMINPTFGSSITSDPQAAAIESTINQAAQVYNNTFSDNINVNITFQESASGSLGSSNWSYYTIPYSTYRNALATHATTAADATALSTLPTGSTNPVTGTSDVYVKTANYRALGFSDSTPSDGTITFNSSLTNPPTSGAHYTLLSVVEHEIDEVLGLSSSLDFNGTNPLPEDLFRYTSSGARNFTTSGDNAYFSIDGSNDIVQFNQNQGTPGTGDYGDWHMSNTARVQDAFGIPDQAPTLGYAEITALDVIGYNAVAVPEPASMGVLALAGAGLLMRRRRAAV